MPGARSLNSWGVVCPVGLPSRIISAPCGLESTTSLPANSGKFVLLETRHPVWRITSSATIVPNSRSRLRRRAESVIGGHSSFQGTLLFASPSLLFRERRREAAGRRGNGLLPRAADLEEISTGT